MKIDLTGTIFGRLRVLYYVGNDKRGKRMWKCVCSCNGINQIVARTETLNSGHSKSCGCLKQEMSKLRLTKHGMRDKTEYKTWLNMRNRCNNPNSDDYPYYGGRGISVTKSWDDFSVFLSDMGEKPNLDYSIERIDKDGNYCKENCRWAVHLEQVRNRGKSRSNTSGTTGVYKYIYESYSAWCSTWCDLEGNAHRKYFSVKKYGDISAKERAIEFRRLKILELNSMGAGYSEKHGT